jgi:hypothetical protein
MLKKCEKCGLERNTNGRALLCSKCEKERRLEVCILEWKSKLIDLNYSIVDFNVNGIHSQVTVTNNECGHAFTAKLNNILSRMTICGECGPKKRPAKALSVYVKKYGRTYDLTKWEDYRHKVRMLSGPNYYKNYDAVNPDKLKRGRVELNPECGHLDHIIPIIYGFKNNLAPEIIADARNLKVLPAKKNLSKKSVMTPEAEALLKVLLEDF